MSVYPTTVSDARCAACGCLCSARRAVEDAITRYYASDVHLPQGFLDERRAMLDEATQEDFELTSDMRGQLGKKLNALDRKEMPSPRHTSEPYGGLTSAPQVASNSLSRVRPIWKPGPSISVRYGDLSSSLRGGRARKATPGQTKAPLSR